MPKSRVRKRTVYTPPPPKTARRKVSAPWVGPAIGICLLVGLAWIVVYYLAGGAIPGLSDSGRDLDAGQQMESAGLASGTAGHLFA